MAEARPGEGALLSWRVLGHADRGRAGPSQWRHSRLIAGSRAASQGCDNNNEAVDKSEESRLLIKVKKDEGTEGVPPENLGGQAGGPSPRPGPSLAQPKSKSVGGTGGVWQAAAEPTPGGCAGAVKPRGPGAQLPSPVGP